MIAYRPIYGPIMPRQGSGQKLQLCTTRAFRCIGFRNARNGFGRLHFSGATHHCVVVQLISNIFSYIHWTEQPSCSIRRLDRMQISRSDHALDLHTLQGSSPCMRGKFFTRRQPFCQLSRHRFRVSATAAEKSIPEEAPAVLNITRRFGIGLLGASLLLSPGR